MPIFYRGAGIGTHWHTNDAQQVGFKARAPRTHPTDAELIRHIATDTDNSPYISLTCSRRVALSYAVFDGLHISQESLGEELAQPLQNE